VRAVIYLGTPDANQRDGLDQIRSRSVAGFITVRVGQWNSLTRIAR